MPAARKIKGWAFSKSLLRSSLLPVVVVGCGGSVLMGTVGVLPSGNPGAAGAGAGVVEVPLYPSCSDGSSNKIRVISENRSWLNSLLEVGIVFCGCRAEGGNGR